jgi:hypothetical protein
MPESFDPLDLHNQLTTSWKDSPPPSRFWEAAFGMKPWTPAEREQLDRDPRLVYYQRQILSAMTTDSSDAELAAKMEAALRDAGPAAGWSASVRKLVGFVKSQVAWPLRQRLQHLTRALEFGSFASAAAGGSERGVPLETLGEPFGLAWVDVAPGEIASWNLAALDEASIADAQLFAASDDAGVGPGAIRLENGRVTVDGNRFEAPGPVVFAVSPNPPAFDPHSDEAFVVSRTKTPTGEEETPEALAEAGLYERAWRAKWSEEVSNEEMAEFLLLFVFDPLIAKLRSFNVQAVNHGSVRSGWQQMIKRATARIRRLETLLPEP